MRIKTIEIQGFKSFADRTLIDFQSGITGIVGPNGCGKSNVVDALRWVMGEMSAKHLRGREMQDIIFSGTEKRAPAGMAEVTLTLTTEDGRVPQAYVGFSEISITRRLFRSGESEYAINKIPSRLRDIYDLFLGTGVGTKAYSIVEQGQVGLIISAKPEDRRRLIEEAAGISKFKARKEAALRKMEAAQLNYTRIQDILTELSKQIASLDRQAKKAEKYRVLRDELRVLELHLSSLQFLDLSQARDLGEKRLAELSEKDATFSIQLAQLEADIEQFRLLITGEEQELSALQESLYEKNNLINLHEQGVQFKQREVKNLAEREAGFSREIEELQVKNQQIHLELDAINGEHLQCDLQVAQAEEQLGTLEKQVLDKEETQNLLQKNLDRLQKEVMQTVQSLSSSTSRKEWMERRKIEIQSRIERNQLEMESIEGEIQKLESRQRQAESSLSGLNQFKLDLSTQSSSLQGSLEREKVEGQILKTENNRLKEELSRKTSRLHSLEEIQKNFEGYQEGVRKILLERASNEKLQEVLGTVADLFEAEPRYQLSVAACLGEKLQFVVVKSQEAGLHAIEYLKAAAVGRSTFIPTQLRLKDPKAKFFDVSESGVLGPLKNFIQVREEYQSLGEYLFQDVWLVENLKIALDLWNRSEVPVTLVTLEGEVIDPQGLLSGGGVSSQDFAILEKKHEMRELSDQIALLKSQLAIKEEALSKNEERLMSLMHSLEHLKKDSHQEELKIVTLEKDLSHLQTEMKRWIQRREELLRERTQFLAEDQNLAEDFVLLSEEIARFEQEKIEKEETLLETRESAAGAQENLGGLKEELTRLRMSTSGIRDRKAQVDKDWKRLLDLQVSYTSRMEEAKKQLAHGIHQTEILNEEINRSQETLTLLISEVRDLQDKQVVLKEGYEGHNFQIKERELSLREIRRQAQEIQAELGNSRIQMAEVRSKLQYLNEQIFERYHTDIALVAPEYQDKPLENRAEKEEDLRQLKDRYAKMGEVNLGAIAEYEELKTRHDFLTTQSDDLKTSLDALARTIHKINRSTRKRFQETFEAINHRFEDLFPKIFQGGKAKLLLTDEENLLETGVEIVAQPPGKKLQSISLLSGGEKALTAISLIFAIFLFKPSPFCVLDEVDAPLDDANVDRYNNIVRQMTDRSQFILITHNKRTMEMADILYGVTMEEAGVSRTVSVRLNEDQQEVA